jgi:homoserine O-acetyltransferase
MLNPKQGDFLIKDFRFANGEVLPELRLHYATLGSPRHDASGRMTNAVLVLHHTGGSNAKCLEQDFVKTLYGRGQPLDTSRWFTIFPDSIGHGQSSKPSDGLRGRFPHYDYYDMVEAQYRMVTEGLGVDHLRLVTGISMGGMHTWLWGTKYPEFMDALMPIVSLPVEIAGRNRMWRRVAMDAIRNDPEWKDGDYDRPPAGVGLAARVFAFSTAGAIDLQRRGPTRDDADRLLEEIAEQRAASDANDFLWAMDSSRTYNPQPDLKKIRARLLAVNAADDFINPTELGILEREIRKVKKGRFVLLKSIGMGHHTGHHPRVWKRYLKEMLADGLRRR